VDFVEPRIWMRARNYLEGEKAGQVRGRYQSLPVDSDEHFWVIARYVERDALRAQLALGAEEW
jgi:putative transposase